MPRSKDKVCAEFCRKFPPGRTNILDEDRVAFMLTNPTIRSKLDDWIGEGKNEGAGLASSSMLTTNGCMEKGKDINVRNHFIELEDNGKDDDENQISRRRLEDTKDIATGAIGGSYSKNPFHSMKQRELGNSLFQQKKLQDSLKAYNDAVRFAPFPNTSSSTTSSSSNPDILDSGRTELLSLSLANRSAVYFELGTSCYEAALADIDLALKCGYPDRLKYKLLLRKANIYVKKEDWKCAQSIIDELHEVINNSVDSSSMSWENIAKVTELKTVVQENTSRIENTSPEIQCDRELDNFQQNDLFENASVGVNLHFSVKSTRFVTAERSLGKADIVFIEKPFASVLLPQFYETHCHDCHRRLEYEYFIPCQQCCQVKFCSEDCAKTAWGCYHQYECLSLDLLHSIGIAHLAARIILCAGLTRALSAVTDHESLTDPKNIALFHCGKDSYCRVYSLLSHTHDMTPEDVFQYSLTAGLLCNWLMRKTNFFKGMDGNDSDCQITKEKVGGCILRHICQLICNAHAITDVFSDMKADNVVVNTQSESQHRIATAIFPAASMMNHSCDPNISFFFRHGKTLIVKSSKEVTEGEEIFNCYGPHWRRMALQSRQDVLNDQYFFSCSCKYCVQESEKETSYADTFTGFKCEKCDGPVISNLDEKFPTGKCQLCGAVMSLDDQLLASVYTDRLFQDGEVLLERGRVHEALKMFITCEEQYSGFLYRHHENLGKIWDTIGQLQCALENFEEAGNFVKKSMEYVKMRFGEESMEYGREVKKYVEVMSLLENGDNQELQSLTSLYKSLLHL